MIGYHAETNAPLTAQEWRGACLGALRLGALLGLRIGAALVVLTLILGLLWAGVGDYAVLRQRAYHGQQVWEAWQAELALRQSQAASQAAPSASAPAPAVPGPSTAPAVQESR